MIVKEYHNRTEIYNDKKRLHSFNDKPALVYKYEDHLHAGEHQWFNNGKLHRDVGPAIIEFNKHH